MKKRMRLRAHHQKTRFQKILFSIVLALFCALIFIYLINGKLRQAIRNYATLESKQFANFILNQAARENLKFDTLKDKNLYEIQKNANDEITTIDFNTIVANEILSSITEAVTKKLLSLENGDLSQISISQSFRGANFKNYKNGVVCEIPIGLLTNHFFLANLGVVIPIRFSFVGMMDANIKSKITSYGINNALIELYILVELIEKITMPLSSEEVKVSLEIPFISQMITGKVPTYYQGGLTGNSNIVSIPLEDHEKNKNL